jgi:peptide deformylase
VRLPVRYYGDPVLRKKGEPVQAITDEIKQLAQDMIETMDWKENNAIGLAAPQIGKSLRMFVLRRYVHLPDGSWTVSEPIVYINPHIISHSKATWMSDEGCVSIPKIHLPVERPVKITVESTRLDGTVVQEGLEGLNARVVLHENDHLNGVLYIDRVKDQDFPPDIRHKLRLLKKQYASSSS